MTRDLIDRTIQSRAMWLGGCAVAGIFLAWVIAGQLRGARSVVSEEAAYITSAPGACGPERWQLACQRWADAGWACITGPEGTPVRVIDIEGKRGAHGMEGYRDVLGIDPSACGDDDPTAEHEVGHLLGLADCPGCPAGDVMASPSSRTGMRIPRRVDP